LREHPLGVSEWSAEALLPLLERMLDGDSIALREAFAVVDRECRLWDARLGHQLLGDTIGGWGEEILLLREHRL